MRLILVLLFGFLLAGCERSDQAGRFGSGEASLRADAVPVEGVFGHKLLFLPGAADAGPAAAFAFHSEQDTKRLDREAYAWLVDGAEWSSVLAEKWRMEPMRWPWLLVPQGPFRLLVAEDGGLRAAVVRRSAGEVRLAPGRTILDWSPAAGARLALQEAVLRTGGIPADGLLLAAQAARTGVPGHDDASPLGFGAFLAGGRALQFVIAAVPETPVTAWLRTGDEPRPVEGARLIATGKDGSASWRIETTGGLTGELRLRGAPIGGGAAANGLISVEGWLDVEGERHVVSGFVWGTVR